MNSQQYREFLVKIKQHFHQKIKANKTNSLPAEQVAQMLYFHTTEEPTILKQFLIKATGKFNITWDDLLRYLQEGISLQETVQKLQISHVSATQIIENNANEFGKLLNYVKQKETNVIQSIQRLPKDIGGEHVFLVCLDKQLVVFDIQKKATLNSFGFSYRNMKQKMFEKDQQKRIYREKLTHRKTQEYLDTVQVNPLKNTSSESRKTPLFPGRFLTNNMKASVRGSVLSSEKSDNLAFRRNSQSRDAKNRNRNQVKIKNDDVNRIFEIFENASLQNSIQIARAFTEARSNFNKNILLDSSLLQKEKKDSSYGLMSEIYMKDFKKDLINMRHDSMELNRRRKIISIDKCSRSKFARSGQISSKRGSFFKQQSLTKSKKSNELQSFINDKHRLQIVSVCVCDNYLLVSLFNREIRLLQLKKGLSSVKYQIIFEKQFKFVVTYLELYKNSNKREYRMIVILDRAQKGVSQDPKKSIGLTQQTGTTQVEIYQLDDKMQIKSKSMECSVDFSAKYQPAFPFGAILYNEKGCFCLLQLKGLSSLGEQRIVIQTLLYNPETNYRVSLSEARAHRNGNSFYLGCSNGYLYLFDRMARRIKYHIHASSCAILDLQLIHNDLQLVSLSKNGNISIHSTLHLEKIYVYQSYHDVLGESKLMMTNQDTFVVYSTRKFDSYVLCSNEEKNFNQQRPIKMVMNRLKLKKHSKTTKKQEKTKVFKVIDGKGGRGDFIALLLEHGEICFLDTDLKYIGSYHYLKIHSVVDILCNDAYQYVSILTSDNTLEVVNIYTQQILFSVEAKEQEQSAALNIRDTPTTTMSQKLKGSKKKHRQTIILNNFFRPDNPSLFMSVITQNNNVYHYSDKGVMNLSINIQKRCGDSMSPKQMIYHEECLVMMTKRELTVLHRQSYYKKCVIDVSEHQLVRIRKVVSEDYEGLLCIDRVCNIFLIDVNLRVVKTLISIGTTVREQGCLFNRHMVLLRAQEEVSRVVVTATKKEQLIKTEKGSFFTIIGTNIVKINQQSGALAFFDFSKSQYQHFQL